MADGSSFDESTHIAFIVPKLTWWVLVKIQSDRNLAETQMKKW